MSQHWPSINSSKRTDDSTRRSTSKINKLRLSLGLSSPKSITNLKSTPNHLVSTSVVSSLSSVYRGLPDRYLSGSQSKRSLPSSSSIAKKCTYRLDAAVLIVSRIKKFIYKHFNIWKLSVGRYLAVERRNHSTKSLVIQVTVSREKKRFHNISKNSVDLQYNESPKSKGKFGLNYQPQNKLTVPKEFELKTEQKNLDFGSQKTFYQKKMFKSFGNEEKVFSKFSFESGPVKPFTRNKAYGDSVGMRRKAQKVFGVLEKRYKKNMEDCFFTIMAVFVFKLNFLKILVNLTRKLKLRMGVFVEDILRHADNIDMGLRMCRVLKSVGKGYLEEIFRKIVFSLNFNQKKNIRDSCESLKKSIREITNSKARIERLRNAQDLKFEKIKNFQVLMHLATKNSIKSVQRQALNLVFKAGLKKTPQKKTEIYNKNSYEYSSLLHIKKNSEQHDMRDRKVLKKLEKNIMKETRFRCRKCFEHWKGKINFVNGKDIYCLKTQTVFNILKEIFTGNLKFALGSIRMYRNYQVKVMKSGFKAKLLKAVKRISKHLNFFKAKAFQKFKCNRHKTQIRRVESKYVTISQFVKILKGKVWKNFRYFYTKASQI